MSGNKRGYTIDATVRGFEGTTAFLETFDKQVVRWPIKNLPEDVREGMTLRLYISTDHTEAEDREKLAREGLNTLLRN